MLTFTVEYVDPDLRTKRVSKLFICEMAPTDEAHIDTKLLSSFGSSIQLLIGCIAPNTKNLFQMQQNVVTLDEGQKHVTKKKGSSARQQSSGSEKKNS